MTTKRVKQVGYLDTKKKQEVLLTVAFESGEVSQITAALRAVIDAQACIDFATKAGVRPKLLFQAIAGEKPLTPAALAKFAALMGVSLPASLKAKRKTNRPRTRKLTRPSKA
jgi:DNA-binding phage protein